MELKTILETIVKEIVQDYDNVVVKEEKGQVLHGKDSIHYKIKVKKENIPLLIGKGGSTIKSLRMLFQKIGGARRIMVFIDVDES